MLLYSYENLLVFSKGYSLTTKGYVLNRSVS